MNGYSSIAEHGFWARSGYGNVTTTIGERVLYVPQTTRSIFVGNFYVGKACSVKGTEVNQLLGTVYEAFFPHLFERAVCLIYNFPIEGVDIPTPVNAGSEALELTPEVLFVLGYEFPDLRI